MRTAMSLSFPLLVCSTLLTSCMSNTADDVIAGDKPDAGGLPDAKEEPTKPTLGNFVRWQNCMTIDDFRTANMVSGWVDLYAEKEQTCEKCHENGAEGFIATPNEQKFFDTLKKDKLYALEYFTYSGIGEFLVKENVIAMTGVSTSQDPHREHPRFDPSQGLAASRLYAALTMARYTTAKGDCAP